MKELTVAVCIDRCVMNLHLPVFLERATLHSQAKIFKWLFVNSWMEENQKTIDVLDRYINEMCVEKFNIWHAASQGFQNGYRDAKYTARTRNEAAAIKRENDKLFNIVKITNSGYKKAVRVIELYKDTKVKYQ